MSPFLQQATAKAPGPIWQATLKDKGSIIFKTDNEAFYDDSLTYFEESNFVLVESDRNYYRDNEPMTAYQAKFVKEGKPIYYAKYQLEKV